VGGVGEWLRWCRRGDGRLPATPIWEAGTCLATDWSAEGIFRARRRPMAYGRVGCWTGRWSLSELFTTSPWAVAATGAGLERARSLERRRPRRRGSRATAQRS